MKHLLKKKRNIYIVQALFLLAFLFGAFWINAQNFNISSIEYVVQTYGYLGVFFGGIISGFNLLVPIPVITLFPFFVQVGLDPVWTVILISLGMVLGDIMGYLIGVLGRETLYISSPKIITRLDRLRNRYPRGVLMVLFFFAALVPLPNEILIIPLSILGISLWEIIPVVIAGNFVFNALAALTTWHATGLV